MARFAIISEIESTEIVICRLKSIITEYYFREILKRETLQVIRREPDREVRNVSGVMNGLAPIQDKRDATKQLRHADALLACSLHL